MKLNKSNKWAWLAVGACAGCCALIPVLTIAGVSSAIGMAVYFEAAAAGFFILGLSLFGYGMFRKKRLTRKGDCSC